VIAFVMRLIPDDEVRHHGLLQRMATTLRGALDWTTSAEALPQARAARDPAPTHSVQIAQALVEEEGTGTRALRRLAAQEKGINDGLDSVLLEMMAMDCEKHAHLLHFVQLRLECPPDLRLADPTIVGWRRNIGLLMSTNGPRRSSVGDGQGASRPFCACSQSASATMITPRTK